MCKLKKMQEKRVRIDVMVYVSTKRILDENVENAQRIGTPGKIVNRGRLIDQLVHDHLQDRLYVIENQKRECAKTISELTKEEEEIIEKRKDDKIESPVNIPKKPKRKMLASIFSQS